MEAQNITYGSLGLLLILVIPIIIFNIKFNISINKRLLFSILRMTIQLTLVGIYLQYIFEYNNLFINIAYITIVVGVATFSTINTCKLDMKRLFLGLFISFFVPLIIILLYFNAVVVKIDYLFDAKYLITIGGMLLGNSLSGNIIGISSFYNSVKENNKEYCYTLGLGASKFEALKPYLKQGLLASINPTIASIATIGLVSLPGMMTGQILGGSMPFLAIKYQLAIMLAILVTRFFSIVLALAFASKQLFNKFDMLI